MTTEEEKTHKALTAMTPTLEQLTGQVIDGVRYEYKHSTQCKVCKSPDALRRIVDSQLMMMRPYKEILTLVAPLYEKFGVEPGEMISYSSLTNHKTKHLPVDGIAARKIIERRAAEDNRLVMDGVETLVTTHGVYELIASLGVKGIIEGKIEPDLKTTLYAIERLEEIEGKATDTYKPEYLLGQLSVILDAMREVLPPDMLDRVSQRIDLKKAQLTKSQLPPGQENYIDADLIEE